MAALSLAIGYPTVASAPHSIANGFKNLLAIAAATEVEFKEAQTIKEFIKVCILSCTDKIFLVSSYSYLYQKCKKLLLSGLISHNVKLAM